MADKARHAFGMLENIDSALSSGAIDAYDILFVKNADGKPLVGWIDKDGNKVIVDDSAELNALAEEIATKVSSADIEAAIATKANVSDVEALEAQLEAKVDVETVETLIKEHTESAYEVIEF